MRALSSLHYAKIAIGGVARRLVSARSANEFVVSRLLELPGVPAKVGQLLAMRTGIELTTRSTEPAMTPSEVLERIEIEAPALFLELAELDPDPRVASLSQVHCGRLRDGRKVAVKVQFAGLAEEISRQVDSAFHAMGTYGPARGFENELSPFQEYFRSSLLEELDYQLEAKRQGDFRNRFLSDSTIVVPRVFFEYSSKTVLTQEWVDSVPVHNLHALPAEERECLARRLVKFQLEGIFREKLVHGDMNPGNWGYDAVSKRLVVYDFGLTLSLEPAQVGALEKLLSLAPNCTPAQYFASYCALGFDPEKLSGIAAALPELTAVLAEPLRSSESWNMKEWKLAERMETLLGKNKWVFRLAGPAWFFGLMRSCQGIFHAIDALGVRLDLLSLSREFVPGISEAGVKNPAPEGVLSSHLKIEISDKNGPLVELEFPARSASNLRELIPEDVRSKIEKEGYRFDEIVAKVHRSNYAPQLLFASDLQGKSYRVWLD